MSTLFEKQSFRVNSKEKLIENRRFGVGITKMQGFTLYRLGRIRNKWITDALSEILSTFMLAIFIYGSGAQDVLTGGTEISPSGRALACGAGLMLAVYCGFNASGACANPSIALMFCLTGKIQWKRYPVYVVCEFIGAFLGACLIFGIYQDMLNMYDGGVRQIYGENATVQIFTSFPREGISKTTGFFDIFVGCGLLTSTTCMLIDPNNAKTTSGLIPLSLVFLLYGIIMSFGVNAGCAINLSLDLSGRLFAFAAGYGSDVWTHGNNWWWVPIVACICGTFAFVTTYQLMIGNHLPMEGTEVIAKFDLDEMRKIEEKRRRSSAFSDMDSYSHNILQSINSINTEISYTSNSIKL